MKTEERYKKVIDWFQANVPEAKSELDFRSPYEMLVAVILSAQCTDKRVNMTTPALFKAFPTVEVMAASSSDEVYTYIKSISYPNNKAKSIVGMAQKVVSD
ncbi:MAG: endonuclease III, partial [Bacteroidia bacterium]|nr:endonuclease III [Bacteroidia bacterium]